jgi:hypothetical protein
VRETFWGEQAQNRLSSRQHIDKCSQSAEVRNWGATSCPNRRIDCKTDSGGMRPPRFASMMKPDRPRVSYRVCSRLATGSGVPNTTRSRTTSSQVRVVRRSARVARASPHQSKVRHSSPFSPKDHMGMAVDGFSDPEGCRIARHWICRSPAYIKAQCKTGQSSRRIKRHYPRLRGRQMAAL